MLKVKWKNVQTSLQEILELNQTFTGILLKPNNIIHSPKLKYFHCLSAFRTGLSLADFIMMAGSIGVILPMKHLLMCGRRKKSETQYIVIFL